MPSCSVLSVRYSICPSVTFVYSVANYCIFKIILPSGSETILVFPTKHYGSIPTGTPVTGAKIAIFNQYLALGSLTAGTSHVVNILTVE